MKAALAHGFILVTILLGLYGQVVLKWQVGRAGAVPVDAVGKLGFVLGMLLNPWVLSALAAAFLGMLTWMLALTRLELSYAYPFTSLSFVFILAASVVFFHEPVSTTKVIGMVLIAEGLAVMCSERGENESAA